MIVLGLLFGTVGQDLFSGTPRYTFGIRELYSGINFVSVAVGMFGVAEILRNLEDERGRTVLVDKVKGSSRPARTSAVPLGQFFGERPSDPPSGFSPSGPRARLVRLLQHREADLPDAEGVRARGRSRALRVPSPRTTRPRRPRSSRSSPWACRPTPSWR